MEFTTKECTNLIQCGNMFISALSKGFNKHKPVFKPKRFNIIGQGKTWLWSETELYFLFLIHEMREHNLPRNLIEFDNAKMTLEVIIKGEWNTYRIEIEKDNSTAYYDIYFAEFIERVNQFKRSKYAKEN